jgi:hypothetical protein
LNSLFGAEDWYEAFYQKNVSPSLFGEEEVTEKIGNFDSIGKYFISRLKTIFPGAADNPLPLFNSRNNPLFLLCFAVGNPKGKDTALRIAKHILDR